MSDILTEMQGVVHDARPAVASAWTAEDERNLAEAAPTAAREEAKRNAEEALLKHLAREAVIAGERDACAARHEQLTRALIAARQQRDELVKAVQDAGGELPQWEV